MKTKTLIILATTCKCTPAQAYEIYKHITNFIGTRSIVNYDQAVTYQYIRVKTKFTREDVEEVLKESSNISSEILDHIDIFDCNEDGHTLKLIS